MDELKAYVTGLAERAEDIRNRAVRPEEDNMLKVSGDGLKAALDLRLDDRLADLDGNLAAAVSVIARSNHESGTAPTLAMTRPLGPPRALQLVFCDLGTPKGSGEWSVYE